MRPLPSSSSACWVLVLTLVVLETVVTDAWRPQGRFGKRRLEDAARLPGTPDGDAASVGALEGLPNGGPDNSGYPVDLDMPVFQHGNIICINKGVKGLFRCVRWMSDSTSD